jgi:hypothetical protein
MHAPRLVASQLACVPESSRQSSARHAAATPLPPLSPAQPFATGTLSWQTAADSCLALLEHPPQWPSAVPTATQRRATAARERRARICTRSSAQKRGRVGTSADSPAPGTRPRFKARPPRARAEGSSLSCLQRGSYSESRLDARSHPLPTTTHFPTPAPTRPSYHERRASRLARAAAAARRAPPRRGHARALPIRVAPSAIGRSGSGGRRGGHRAEEPAD